MPKQNADGPVLEHKLDSLADGLAGQPSSVRLSTDRAPDLRVLLVGGNKQPDIADQFFSQRSRYSPDCNPEADLTLES